MRPSAYLYVIAVTSTAVLLLAFSPWAELAQLRASNILGFLVFVGLGILAEAMAVDFAVGSKLSVKSSISFLPLLACAATFPQPAPAIAGFLIHSFTEVFFRKRVLWRVAFNSSQLAIATWLSSLVYRIVGGRTLPSFDLDFAAFAALAATFFTTNVILVSGFFAIRERISFSTVLKRAIGPGGGNLFYDLLASPVAIFATILYVEFDIPGLILLVFPLLLIRYSYLSKLQLQRANRDLLRVLVKTIETRDPYTSGHSIRVSTLARAIAEDVGLRGRNLEQIETAALLHDIGKIDTIYATLIRKPYDLTEEERNVIRTHATKGADLLTHLTSLEDQVIRGVRHHHERYDGSGYPDRLKGQEIPIAARIIMLCDSIDAMLSDRPYRPALGLEQTRAELLRFAGTQFDPDIVHRVLERRTLERAGGLAGRTPAIATEGVPLRVPAQAQPAASAIAIGASK